MTFAPAGEGGATPARQPTPFGPLPDGTGLDVGSTSVKVVVASGGAVLHRAYERHRGQAAACVEAMLAKARAHAFRAERIVMTGSLGAALAHERGIPHVHEVHAVAQAVRAQFPRARTVVELGGQDAKLILLEEGLEPRISTEMNDRCAAGTGATLDRCLSRLGFDGSALSRFELPAGELPDVSARCGVFAESDLVTLVKSGVPTEQAVGGLLAALVRGNLATLGKSHVLAPPVILLGGPHAFVPALAVLWSKFLAQRWAQRGEPRYADASVTVPDNALYMAAEGALRLARAAERRRRGSASRDRQPPASARFSSGVAEQIRRKVCAGLLASSDELPRAFRPAPGRESDQGNRLWLGIDAGSTTIKGVVLGDDGAVRATLYRRAERNPLEDGQALLAELSRELGRETGRIDGLGMTGYAADVLGPVFGADAAPVETVAHAASAHHFFPDADVVCDIGGQDVKILLLEHGTVKDFHLSNQCAAGNGVLLEAVARELGVPLADYAEIAFSADRAPRLNVGCAVFLDTERVSLERDGFTRGEILAGFAAVLPRNVWENVVAAPNLALLGRVFVLSGGVQRNLAAVKAQLDYIRERHPDASIHVHPYPAEAGAIGAALAARAARRASPKQFRGVDPLLAMTFSSTSDRTTRCTCCPNQCRRTVVQAVTDERHALTLVSGHACERGADLPALGRHRAPVPWARNLLRTECARLFEQHVPVDVVSDAANGVRVVMPRALAMYRSAPFFRHYLEAIGVARGAISMSPETEDVQRLPHREGRGPDACFPAKLAQAHVAAVLAGTRRSRFDVLFFPILTHAKTSVRGCRDSMACPLVTGAPLVCRALFGRGSNALPNGTRLSMPVLNLTEPELLAEQLHRAVREFVPGLSQREHLAALNEAGRAQAHIERQMELDGIRLIARARHERRAAVVLLGRPYHVDPGIHHDIGSELRALGRSTLSLRALPRGRAELLEGPERRSDFSAFWDVGREGHALTNSGCAEKLAAARLVASEPYLVALEFSSFKCGQDAALYASISAHARGAGKPFLALHDMDETRPVASLRLRLRTFLHGVEAYEHALRQHAS